MKKAILIDGKDNVATVASDVEAGEAVEVLSPEGEVVMRPVALDAIPFGHKIALADLRRGDRVIKYGEVIGVASTDIRSGGWVHTHNVESAAVPTSAYGRAGP
ncbi:D-galactarate dehydratase [Candidatus Bathyarchaeota archaeon]|nr:MAG: D-galactarate dehydratase [Candidatus Bathyarchaeota archaeon]